MSEHVPIDTITALGTLGELEAFLQSQPIDIVRNELLRGIDALLEYADANQWATAVRICEALAIIGWGTREQVDAISRYNGDCWETQFVTDKDELRFRLARWSKRKAGWTLWNPEFHASPDFPDRPSVDWKQNAGTEFPIVDRDTLPSQRNYRRQMPIIMGMIGGVNTTSNSADALRMELRKHLLETMTPAAYGDAVEKFYFTFHCPFRSTAYDARLKIGAYNTKQKAFYSDLYFGKDFGQLSRTDQLAFISQHLLAAVDALEVKLRKRKVDYDVAAFRADVETAIDCWSEPRRATSAANVTGR